MDRIEETALSFQNEFAASARSSETDQSAVFTHFVRLKAETFLSIAAENNNSPTVEIFGLTKLTVRFFESKKIDIKSATS